MSLIKNLALTILTLLLILGLPLTGCIQAAKPTPSSTPTEKPYLTFTINPSITATHTRTPPTKTPAPTSIMEVVPTPQVFQPLPINKDYILYVDQNPDDYSNEIWAVNPQENKPFLVLKGMGLWPQGWSPSGEKWLFSSEHALYVANKDGSGIQQVYNDPRYIRFEAGWLSDHIILMNAYTDLTLPPDLYQLDIGNKAIVPVTIDVENIIQGISPDNNVWLVSNWKASLHIIDTEGIINEFLRGYKIEVTPFRIQTILFIPKSDDFIFWGSKNDSTEVGFWKGSFGSNDTILLFDTTEIWNIGDRKLSPDGKWFGFVSDNPTSSGRIFTVIDVNSAKVMYQMDYPYTLSDSIFNWSPGSSSIVLPYQVSDASGVFSVMSGLQIMDIKTGKTTVILMDDIINSIAWQFIR